MTTAETVGPEGKVTGVEFDPDLAARARANLAHLPSVEVVEADGGAYDAGECEAVFVNAGVTHPRAVWLDRLSQGGRLILPLTVARSQDESGGGFMLKIWREGDAYAARFLSPVAIFPCAGRFTARRSAVYDVVIRSLVRCPFGRTETPPAPCNVWRIAMRR